jgi:hypothetical protein
MSNLKGIYELRTCYMAIQAEFLLVSIDTTRLFRLSIHLARSPKIKVSG